MKDDFGAALKELDDALSKREDKINRINAEYEDEHGKIFARDYSEYRQRKEHVEQSFRQEALDVQEELNALCVQARKRQPELRKLSPDNVPKRSYHPRRVLFGKVRVRYEGDQPWEAYLPCQLPFPFPRPLCLRDNSAEQVCALALRLLYALPVGKILFHIADPQGMGSSVSALKPLLDCPEILPEKKFLRTAEEIGDCLENALSYAENLIQKVFPTGCENWRQYNRIQWKTRSPGNVLPCHVFVFLDLPHGVDETVMQRLVRLAKNGARCGCAILFSYDPAALAKGDEHAILNRMLDRKEELLQKLLENSVPLDGLGALQNASFRWLQLSRAEESLPVREQYAALLEALKDATKRAAASGADFPDLAKGRELFDSDSADGLVFPIGFDAKTEKPLEIHLDDASPHYLLGGATGSGKSNFLHILIMSLCTRFSPEQAELYLMDFKDGVEFAKYANPSLPHARLVAQAADPEYGASVLEGLVRLKEERNDLFKQRSVKDITGFRRKFPKERLPRIVLIVDEFQVLLGTTSESGEVKRRATNALSILAKQGRACGIHLIFATQSLSGVDFSALNTQFVGRIALKCSTEDSKELLNDLSNDEAAELHVPLAILNTENGRKSGNRRCKIPEAKEELIRQTVETVREECRRRGIQSKATVFSGLEFPLHPPLDFFCCDGLPVFRLGEQLTFPAAPLDVRPQAKRYNHLLVCGGNERFKRGLLRSLLLSAEGSLSIRQIFYIGERELQRVGKPLRVFRTMVPWVQKWLDSEADFSKVAHSLVILDQCDPVHELGYPAYGELEGDAKTFSDFLSKANKAECFCAAFYDRKRQMDASFRPVLDEFNHALGYGLSKDEIDTLLGYGSSVSDCPPDRAFYANNKKIEGWFRPYVEAENGS